MEQVNAYLAQLAATSGGDKGPAFDPYQYMQASVGAPGVRGITGKVFSAADGWLTNM